MEQQSTEQLNLINKDTNKEFTVDVIIPTYHSDEKFDRLITMLYQQTKKPNKVIILHTQEFPGQEQQVPEIPQSNIIILPIDKKSFDHGGTRKYGASQSDADILMFMTQDAVPEDEFLIENLIRPYQDDWVCATYARQLPNENSDLLERYTRSFNYPKESRIKDKSDTEKLGIKTYFCSNVCSTYRNIIYQKLGGFVEKTIFNEDMIMAAGMIQADYKIAYVAEARVIHSHHYSYLQQFTRNFDLGVSHKEYSDIFREMKSESEGMRLVKKSLQHLIDNKRYLMIPDLILNSGFKFLGYQLGVRYDILPINMVRQFSMNKSYWKDNK